MWIVRKTIIFLTNWFRFSSSSWVEYYYRYYSDIVTDTYRAINENVIINN